MNERVKWTTTLNWSRCSPGRLSGSILVVVEGERPLALHRGHVGPVVAGARQQHVTEQRFNGRLAHQADKEQLLNDRRGDDAQRRQSQEEPPKPVWLAGVLVPYIFLQGALGFFLDAFNVGDI